VLQANEERTLMLRSGYNAVQFDANVTLETLKTKIGFQKLLNIQGAGQGTTYKKEYIDQGLEFLNSFTQTEFGKAYWIQISEDVNISYIPETYIGTKTIELTAGWNFVGSPLPLTLEEIKNQLGADNLLVIQGAGQGRSYKKEYVDNGTSFLNSFTAFESGQGYWIKVENRTSLELVFKVKKYPITTILQANPTDINLLKPTVDNPSIDAVFNTRIAMVDKSDNALANYPKVQTWNSDMTLMRIGSRLYDAQTLKESDYTKNSTNPYATLCSRNSDYFRWSNNHFNTFFVLDSSNRLIQGQINENNVSCSNVLETFNDYEKIHIGPHEGNIDSADKYLLFSAKKPNDTTIYLILYDIPNHRRVWTKTLTDDTWFYDQARQHWQPRKMDWISVSPSGKYIILNNNNGNRDGMYHYDIHFTNKTKLQYRWDGNNQLYSEGGHGDMGYDSEGHEVWVQFISGVGVYSFNLDNPNELGVEQLHSPYGGGHVSCRNTKRKGWCYITANLDSNGNGLKRIFALKLDGTGDENVENFAQSHINDTFEETYGGASPDGTKMIFNSHWGTNSVETFVVEAN
jgi:hypothetical protein